jgi:hypothetical protein
MVHRPVPGLPQPGPGDPAGTLGGAAVAKVTARTAPVVAERNESGPDSDSQERDFARAERVRASNNRGELD